MRAAKSVVLSLCFIATSVAVQDQPYHNVKLGERAAAGILDGVIKGNVVEPLDNSPQAFFLEAQRLEKNVTMETIHDRSLELIGRQSCDAGYFACPGRPRLYSFIKVIRQLTP